MVTPARPNKGHMRDLIYLVGYDMGARLRGQSFAGIDRL
jgi:hypothetical protein